MYVYAGQRGKEFLNDFYAYDVDNDTVQLLAESNRGRGDSNAGKLSKHSTIYHNTTQYYTILHNTQHHICYNTTLLPCDTAVHVHQYR